MDKIGIIESIMYVWTHEHVGVRARARARIISAWNLPPYSFLVYSSFVNNHKCFCLTVWERFCGLVGSALDHRSLPAEFEFRRGHIWRVFHLWLRFITFGGCSAHLGYHVHKAAVKYQSSSSSLPCMHDVSDFGSEARKI